MQFLEVGMKTTSSARNSILKGYIWFCLTWGIWLHGFWNMKKRIRRRPPDEIKVIEKKRLDEMERLKTTREERCREFFYRKPYGMRDIRDD